MQKSKFRVAARLAGVLTATFLIANGSTSSTLHAQAASASERGKALSALIETIWQDTLKHQPEFATSLGDKRYNDQLTDYSVEEVNASLARERRFIEQLAAIDTTGLSVQEQVSYDLMMRDMIDDQEGAKFKEWQMPVTQFGGIHTGLASLVDQFPFDTVKDYDDYIARLNKIPTVFSQVTTNMQLGMLEGRIPPKFLLEKALVQTHTLADNKSAESPFAGPLKKFPKTVNAAEQKRITAAVLDAIDTQVLPAYRRFERFLNGQYIAKGRTEIGASSLPDGQEYYAFRIRQSTTLNKTADEIHQIGLDEVRRDEAEMLTIARKLGFADLKSFNAAIKVNPKEHPATKEALLQAYRGHIDDMKVKLPTLFGRLPKAPLEVLPVPSYVEKDQAAAYYYDGTPDGSRPGRVYVNTYKFADRALAQVEATAYHEGLPGHHMQIAIAQELTGLPEFRKHEYYTAYTEGWALYSERLGKEVGFYQDPYSDYGRLDGDMLRAIRLVVDTGVHSQHWTREQMVDFFHEHSGTDEADIQAEVDRYIAWPAQALGYKMGQLKILELRAKAQTTLGPKFKLSEFHDQVLDVGALPMDVLEKRIDAWAAQGGGGK